MAFLEDLKKKLSSQNADAFAEKRLSASKPGFGGTMEPPGGVEPPPVFDAAADARSRRRRTILSVLLLFVVVGVALGTVAGVRWSVALRTVQKHHIQLSASSTERVTSGDDLAVDVRLENAGRVPWENVTVTLQAPDGFTATSVTPSPVGAPPTARNREGGAPGAALVWAVGNFPPRAAAAFAVTGRLLAEEGTSALFTARVTLTPGNRPGRQLEKTSLASVVVAGIPVDLTIDVPTRASSGTPVTVRLAYQNRTSRDLQGARVVLEAPAGFTVSSSVPPVPGRELSWDLGAVPPQGQGEITVSGIIEGEPDTAKPFVAQVGLLAPGGRFLVQRHVQRTLTIARAALSLTQVLNGEQDILKVDPGTGIQGKVQYKNTGTGGLREVIVRLAFEGAGLDAGSVRVDGGFFDSRARQITWSAASSPALRVLRPGGGGELGYRFRMLSQSALPFAKESDRNFQLVTQAIGDSPDLPVPPGAPKQVATDRFEVFLNTVPALTLDAFFDDGRAGLPPSTGPLPPQVGQETVLTIRARVGNTSNDLIDAVYRTVLPEGVKWVAREYHTTGDIRFNERTRDVLWTIPLVPARAGTGLPGPEFAYQVAIVPSVNQVGSDVPLTRGHTLEGTDAFTTSRLRAEAASVTTGGVGSTKGQVVR